VGFWTFLTNVLADLKLAQAVDDERADDESGKQCGQAGERGTERKITENSERREIMEQ